LKASVSVYWKGVVRNYAISAFAFAAGFYTLHIVPINPYKSIWAWVMYSAVGMVIFLTYDITATILFAKGAKDSLQRIKNIRKK
jgi:phosphotransferase system  glucose/maltose/N-acetylglucosamine-specific IIC component